MTALEACETCGFVWDDVAADEVEPRILAATMAFAELLRREVRSASRRPDPGWWPRAATRTLRWVAAQALHECEHHLGDAEQGAQRLEAG